MRPLEEKALALLRRAVAEGEPLIGTYLDTERMVVVRVKDGRCVPDEPTQSSQFERWNWRRIGDNSRQAAW